MSPQEFYNGLFDLSFMNQEEQETIFKATALYAKGACKAQREICANELPPKWKEALETDILKAPEPDCIKNNQ